jgi:superfamily I DNA/RNA helicase
MEFDPDQERVVGHGDGHALILAGAGSGKTACCVGRCVRRIRSGIPAESILLLTFTNKAASEMRERIAAALDRPLGPDDSPSGKSALPLASTFHSWGYRFIRQWPVLCGRGGRAGLMDDRDASDLLDQSIYAHAPYLSRPDATRLRRGIERVRAEGVCATADPASGEILWGPLAGDASLAEAVLDSQQIDSPEDVETARIALWNYTQRKEFQNLLDFDDLILLPERALRTNPRVRDRLRTRFVDITVDESQDTNGGQYRLLRQLAGQTVVMVGDDDQGIYSFRGARPRNLRDFRDEFSPIEYRLERNYRSLPGIVNPASRLIRKNRDRLEKNPRPVRTAPATMPTIRRHPSESQSGSRYPRATIRAIGKLSHTRGANRATGDPEFIKHPSGERMAEQIARGIRAQINRGTPLDEIAVLYRVNAITTVLEPALLRFQIPYWVKDSTALLSRPVARILVGIARLCHNPADEPALRRMIELVPGVGDAALRELSNLRTRNGYPGLLDGADALRSVARGRLIALREGLEVLRAEGPSQVSAWAFRHGLAEWMDKHARGAMRSLKVSPKKPEYRHLLEKKLQWYSRLAEEVQCVIDTRIKDVRGKKDQWADVLEILCAPPIGDERPKVMLTTVHGAKGLEWNSVHLAGFSEGLMPLTPRDGGTITQQDLEEERRLAYVAMTRAKDHLYLHHPANITLNGRFLTLQGSRFVREYLPEPDKKEVPDRTWESEGVRPT